MPGETDPVAKPARQPSGAGSDIDDIARGWVLPSEDDVSAVWASAEIVLDTNVLLNLYRYSAKARDELLSLLTHIGSRLWLPHQVAHEFFRNRMAVRVLDQTAEEKLTAAVDAAAEILLKQVDKMNADLSRRNEPPPHEARIREALENLRGELVAVEKKRAGDLGSHHDDEVLRAFRRLFGQRVGREPTPDDRTELYAEGKKRYERQIPPGFKDTTKSGDREYGDWLVWRQIIDHAKQSALPIIFVTDDSKRDWVWEVHGRSFGARPELVREIHDQAKVAFLLSRPSSSYERQAIEF